MIEKKLKVAMIGCGNISWRHFEGVEEKEECELYAVCDNATDDRLEKCKEKYGAVRAVTDYRELLDDPEIDVAIITTPDNCHMEQTVAFLMAGKDVLLEKPMALTAEECAAMIRAEKESGRKLMVGQVSRFAPAFAKAKKMIDDGLIGEL